MWNKRVHRGKGRCVDEPLSFRGSPSVVIGEMMSDSRCIGLSRLHWDKRHEGHGEEYCIRHVQEAVAAQSEPLGVR